MPPLRAAKKESGGWVSAGIGEGVGEVVEVFAAEIWMSFCR